jgi:hypothetical protein
VRGDERRGWDEAMGVIGRASGRQGEVFLVVGGPLSVVFVSMLKTLRMVRVNIPTQWKHAWKPGFSRKR